jgi:hypothetical protein
MNKELINKKLRYQFREQLIGNFNRRLSWQLNMQLCARLTGQLGSQLGWRLSEQLEKEELNG